MKWKEILVTALIALTSVYVYKNFIGPRIPGAPLL